MSGKVSVIIPAFNSEKFIAETIESVLRQTYAELEILIIDDGSTDGTGDLVNSIGDPRIKYIRRENGGTAAARNTGMKAATGSYIAFLDHDDLWMPEKVKKQVKFLCDTGEKVVFCNGTENPSGRPILKKGAFRAGVEDLYGKTLMKENLTPSSLLFGREVINKTGFLEERISGIDDWDFSINLARNFKIGYIEEYLYSRREHGDNLTLNIRSRGYFFNIIYERQKPFLTAEQEKILKNSIANELFNWARKNMSFLKPGQGLESWAFSVRFNKLMLFKLPGLMVRYLRFNAKKRQ